MFKQKQKLWLIRTAIIGSIFSLTSCSLINSQFGKGTEVSNVSEEEITTIMKKYDDVFKNETYDGQACTLEMVHWDGSGQSVEMSVINTMLRGFQKRYPKINVNLTILYI